MVGKLKLMAELVPQTSWYNNLRKAMPRSRWDKIRKATYAEYDNRCGICGAEGRLNCHELWKYNDKTHVQKLTGFIALCDLCHFVKHLGFAEILANEGKLDYETVVEHFMCVNGCDRETFERHKERAFNKWDKRSEHNWTVGLGEYKQFVNHE